MAALCGVGLDERLHRRPSMTDLIFLVLGGAFFAGFIAYTLLCERL
jgi:hypothetical protein